MLGRSCVTSFHWQGGDGGVGGGSGGGRFRMDSYGRMVVRVTRNSLRWGVGSGMSKV